MTFYLKNANLKSDRNLVSKSVIDPNCLNVISLSAVEAGVVGGDPDVDDELLFSTVVFFAGNVFERLMGDGDDSSAGFSYTDWLLAIEPRFPYFFRDKR